MRARVSSETPLRPLSTLETVEMETSARAATSARVARVAGSPDVISADMHLAYVSACRGGGGDRPGTERQPGWAFATVPCCRRSSCSRRHVLPIRGEFPLSLADLPLDELVRYLPTVAEPDDFDDFWRRTLTEARAHDLDVRSQQVGTPYRTVTVWDVSFSGFGGDRISA